MASFKLTEAAKLDLRRIYLRGLEEFGEAQADKYYNALFDRFQALAEQPLAYPAVEDLRPGYRRSVCGVDSIYNRIDGDHVVIAAVLGQQDIDSWL